MAHERQPMLDTASGDYDEDAVPYNVHENDDASDDEMLFPSPPTTGAAFPPTYGSVAGSTESHDVPSYAPPSTSSLPSTAVTTTSTSAVATSASATASRPSATTAAPRQSTVTGEARRRQRVAQARLPDDFLRLTVEAPPGHAQGYGNQPAAQMVSYRGILRITVLEARLAKNYGFARMDPFCRFNVGTNSYTSAICQSGGKEPRWNQRVDIPVTEGFHSLKIQVLTMGTFSDRLIGWGEVDFTRAIQGDPFEEWFPLSGKQGEDKEGVINLHLKYDLQPVYQPTVMPPVPQFAPMMHPMGTYAPQYYQTGPPPPQTYYGGLMPPNGPAPMHQQPGFQHPQPPVSQRQQQQQPPPQQVSVSAEDVAQLQEMFPDADPAAIRSVLQANQGDKDAAIVSLLAS